MVAVDPRSVIVQEDVVSTLGMSKPDFPRVCSSRVPTLLFRNLSSTLCLRLGKTERWISLNLLQHWRSAEDHLWSIGWATGPGSSPKPESQGEHKICFKCLQHQFQTPPCPNRWGGPALLLSVSPHHHVWTPLHSQLESQQHSSSLQNSSNKTSLLMTN